MKVLRITRRVGRLVLLCSVMNGVGSFVKMFDRHLRTLSHVPRWAIIRLIHTQSVADHSYYVAIYADQIAEYIGWKGDRHALILLALQHDWGEIVTGDIPHPTKAACIDSVKLKKFEEDGLAKRINTHYPNMSVTSKTDASDILRCADMIEGVLYLMSEKTFGNKDVGGILELMMEQVYLVIDNLPCSEALKGEILRHFRGGVEAEVTERSGINKGDTDAGSLHGAREKEDFT